jgi:hypothetical protein
MSFLSRDIGKTYRRFSTTNRPADATENSILYELDTEDEYRFNQYGRWEYVPHMSYKSKRLHSLYMPKNNQTGLMFGDETHSGVNIELHSTGCMIYQVRSSSSVVDTKGFAAVNDFAQANLTPKCQTVFSFNDTATGNSAAFIGLYDDTISMLGTTAGFIPNDAAVVGIGYRSADTNIFVFHNDTTGAVNAIDTGIAKSTNIYMVEVSYDTSTEVRVSIYDIDMVQVYETTLTTEIPVTNMDLGYIATVVNANTLDQYVINIFDFVRLEKTKGALNPTTDF